MAVLGLWQIPDPEQAALENTPAKQQTHPAADTGEDTMGKAAKITAGRSWFPGCPSLIRRLLPAVLGTALALLPGSPQAGITMQEEALFKDLLNNTDGRTKLFLLNAYTNRGKMIENSLQFALARGLLPVSYAGYTLEGMEIRDRTLHLRFSTEKKRLPDAWRRSPARIRSLYTALVCRFFEETGVSKIDRIASVLYHGGQEVFTLGDGRDSCR